MKRITTTVLLGLVLAACASTSAKTYIPQNPAAASSATTTTANIGPKVLQILNTGSAQIAKDKNITNTTKMLSAVSSDFSDTATQLQALAFPVNAQVDAKKLIHDLNKLSYDASSALAEISNPTLLQAVEQTIVNDEGTKQADSDALRSDLGLPKAS